ncbi:hypothetical protein [Acuticoccus sp.]|uniref:hypothetical protein n=1 Tax=Acuticoccus sp. TaxID=1904378 RepID=UPI003B516B58
MTTLMMGSLYDALRQAGADEEKAREAATDVADHGNRLHAIERRLVEITGRLKFHRLLFGFLIGLGVTTLGLVVRLSIVV